MIQFVEYNFILCNLLEYVVNIYGNKQPLKYF